mmetsp:Transcript_69946/g.227698  ORF Transcript_69946/g.227698 Transcript_69946/m.227698 type:complete len:233 (+) Transcript_69946:984-1682(+)
MRMSNCKSRRTGTSHAGCAKSAGATKYRKAMPCIQEPCMAVGSKAATMGRKRASCSTVSAARQVPSPRIFARSSSAATMGTVAKTSDTATAPRATVGANFAQASTEDAETSADHREPSHARAAASAPTTSRASTLGIDGRTSGLHQSSSSSRGHSQPLVPLQHKAPKASKKTPPIAAKAMGPLAKTFAATRTNHVAHPKPNRMFELKPDGHAMLSRAAGASKAKTTAETNSS